MSDISVYCLKYGEGALPEGMVFPNGSNSRTVPISFAVYLVITPKRNILIDAGCDSMSDFQPKNFRSPAVVLKEVTGMSAEDITDVIITHCHFDHIEALKHFKIAKLHITKKQYGNGNEYIPNEMEVTTYEGSAFIEKGIKITEIGGHCYGSAAVEIENGDTIHVFCGDECYTDENIKSKIPTGASEDIEKSRSFIEKYSSGKYTVHTCHDMALKSKKII